MILAEDGDSALKLALEHRPDAILADVLMPGWTGSGSARRIRAEPTLSALPVVLMSAHYLEEEDRSLG